MKSNHSKYIGSTRSRPADAGDESRLFMKAWVRKPNSQLYLTVSIIFRRGSLSPNFLYLHNSKIFVPKPVCLRTQQVKSKALTTNRGVASSHTH